MKTVFYSSHDAYLEWELVDKDTGASFEALFVTDSWRDLEYLLQYRAIREFLTSNGIDPNQVGVRRYSGYNSCGWCGGELDGEGNCANYCSGGGWYRDPHSES